MGKIFYVMGKSSVGKDTVYRELMRKIPTLKRMIPFTTRPKRDGEMEGREYHFLSEEALEAYRVQGKLIEKRVYRTVMGLWIYATIDDGTIDLKEKQCYLGIGTLESYLKLSAYFGKEMMYPLYIEVEDGERLRRALRREEKQNPPRYDEMCRRYLADETDFKEERLEEAGIKKRYHNVDLDTCLADIIGDVIKYV